ncbi:hypothetical protein ONZ45_g7370 [Pleurotus djamor]|nr:hypothetical protein ONZ45_g7370 [Pleurotus djamor]
MYDKKDTVLDAPYRMPESDPPPAFSHDNTQAAGPPPVFRTQFACMSMNMYDRLRFIQFPVEHINTIRTAIQQSWAKGIQEERNYHGSHEFKLKGNPWYAKGSEASPSRVLMCGVLSTLYSMGWILCISTDISKKQADKDTCIFRYQQPLPPPCTWFAISFNMGDRLRLIGAPEELVLPFKQILGSMLQKDGWKDGGVYEFKCEGYPWMASGSEAVSTRILLLRMIEVLESFGYSLYASLDQNASSSSGDSGSTETDTWYCYKQVSWTPGAPVFH